MSKDEETTKTKDIQKETARTQARLFSRKEVEDIVKEFVRAYIRGQVTLSPVVPTDIENNPNLATLPDNQAVRLSDAINLRTSIKDMICIVAGTKTATDHEYEKCVSDLFETISIMRLTDSMKGFILTTDVDGRLTSLEQNIKDITDKQDQDDLLIRRILDYLERNDPYRERKWYSSRNV